MKLNPYTEQMKTYLNAQLPYQNDNDVKSILDMLYHVYAELNPIDNASIRSLFEDIGSIFRNLTLRENDLVFDLICQLCTEIERLAFMEGIYVGAKLTEELNTK